MTINLKSLVSKLNPTCQRALEAAAGMCLSRTHYNVEIEHWLLKLLDEPNSDLTLICNHYQIDVDLLKKDLLTSLDHLKTGNGRTPALSQNIVDLCRQAWLLASLEYGIDFCHSGHLLLALLQDEGLARLAKSISKQFNKISADNLQTEMRQLVATSQETTSTAVPTGSQVSDPKTKTKNQAALDQYTVDLTELARQGKIDPVLGRDHEVRQIIDILTRRRQNNPILTGEAGVGKTAVVEGFALRVVSGDVPPSLKNIIIRRLDLGLLQAGAGIKGEFENRLKSVINEVKSSAQPVILFIDEAHTLIGAGGQAGQGDAANLLKPELARGELRTIAATTWSEYKKYFEQDPALTRRFQVVKVEEPTEASAITMLQGMVDMLEKHHGVHILNEAVNESVRLSSRYLTGRQLPDKAVSLLDTACARVAVAQAATPPTIEDNQRQIEQLETAKRILNHDTDLGISREDQLDDINQQKEQLEIKLKQLNQQWDDERKLIKEMHECYQQIKNYTSASEDNTNKKRELQSHIEVLTNQLQKVQGEFPLMQPWVDEQSVAAVIGGWTGIPVGRMVHNEIDAILTLSESLQHRIIGQTHALQAIGESVKTSRAKLTDPRKPIGVFLFTGPSGVGKTETALALAELLYGSEQNLTIINMSEFKEEHKVSTLVGAPPGYVGYGQGGVLTEAVRRKPYSLLLLDEMEKAHPGVHDIFYQVFDKGIIRDSEGRDIDFKNTLIIMTSNACTDVITKLCNNSKTIPDVDALADSIQPELLKLFKPAFLGRVQIIPFYPLSDENMKKIIELQLRRVQKRIKENHRAELTYHPDVINYILERCNQTETGARTIEHLLNRSLLPELSTHLLTHLAENKTIQGIKVNITDSKFDYEIDTQATLDKKMNESVLV